MESVSVHPAGFGTGRLAVGFRDLGVDSTQQALAAAADVTPATVHDHRDPIEAERAGWAQ